MVRSKYLGANLENIIRSSFVENYHIFRKFTFFKNQRTSLSVRVERNPVQHFNLAVILGQFGIFNLVFDEFVQSLIKHVASKATEVVLFSFSIFLVLPCMVGVQHAFNKKLVYERLWMRFCAFLDTRAIYQALTNMLLASIEYSSFLLYADAADRS